MNTGLGTATISEEQLEAMIEALPVTMRPWKSQDLENVKIYLPLGDGESIHDKLYRFAIDWQNEIPNKPRLYQQSL
jgi:hypothetical protein